MDMYELMHMPNVLWGTAQLPSTPPDRWEHTVEHWLADEQMHIFVADIQNKVVGMVRVRTGQGRRKHIGYLSMAVHDKYQGQGIGKMLVLTAIDLSDNWLNLTRLELDVYTDNERALRLYKNFDFEIEGRIRCSSFRSGKYIDSYLMARIRLPNTQSHAEHVTQVVHGTPVGQSAQHGQLVPVAPILSPASVQAEGQATQNGNGQQKQQTPGSQGTHITEVTTESELAGSKPQKEP
jgi:putative acetyltransferase